MFSRECAGTGWGLLLWSGGELFAFWFWEKKKAPTDKFDSMTQEAILFKTPEITVRAACILSPSHLLQSYHLWLIPCPPYSHSLFFPGSLPPPMVFAVPSGPFWPPEKPTQSGWIHSAAHKPNLNRRHRNSDVQCLPCLLMRLIHHHVSSDANLKIGFSCCYFKIRLCYICTNNSVTPFIYKISFGTQHNFK